MVRLGLETVDLPGGESLELEVVRHPGGAAVAAVDARQRICLLRQYRHAGGGWLWELPAGKLDPGEAPAATARRELEEEAGLRAATWEPLGSILTTPGFCDEEIHLFLARDLVAGDTRHGVHERIEVHWLPLREALAWADTGEIRDAKTLVGLWRTRSRLAVGR